jgi:Contractile injection system tube protein
MTLTRATLQRLVADSRGGAGAGRIPDGDPVSVQFNPATLRLSRRNNVDRTGVTTGSQKRHQPAPEASTLAFDLEFDTAEQGQTEQWVDVRRWTALVRQFVEPSTQAPKDAPPAVRFAWGTLIFDGIIDQVTEELDHFAPDGTPLRAKVSVSIAEQNPDFETGRIGPAARTAPTVTPAGSGTGRAPGNAGTGRTDRVVPAQQGESAQQLLARIGLDPAGWRAAMTGLQTPLGLPAGAAVQLGPETREAGPVAAAPDAGFAASGAVASPAELSAALTPGATGAGLVLAAAGGVVAAAATVQQARASAADRAARAAFGAPAAGSGTSSPTGPGSAAGTVDPRPASYGRDVPLRPRPVPDPAAPGSAGGRRQRPGDGCHGTLGGSPCGCRGGGGR